ncbi:hypothetical protein LCGC14_2003170, partial [marine sediment metagenome]
WETHGFFTGRCFLCEYDNRRQTQDTEDCELCSYYKVFGDCDGGGKPYRLWVRAKTNPLRKRYAKLFLEQMEEIRDAENNNR